VDLSAAAIAVILGIVEGLTEFIPVSSTGHLILADTVLGVSGPASALFDVVIQVGAILAVCWAYRDRLFATLRGLGGDPRAQRFTVNVILAFLPAAVIGALAHGFIKSVLFSPWVVAVSLIVGGVAILVIERIRPPPRVLEVDEMRIRHALKIGLCQCVAMIPGVSRSGATIVSAMLLGADKRAAAEFSFFLAIPTMIGAFAYDFYHSRSEMTADHMGIIAIGFVVSFITALIVVKAFLGYVTRHGFALFAWWRVIVGTLGLVALALGW
jgi:undecaprenyl-diphosphatase